MRGPRVHHRQVAVIVGGTADEYPDAATPQARCRDVGALQCLPGQFEGQPLLGVEVIGLHLRQREEFRVETLEVLQISPAGAGIGDPFGQPRLIGELRPAPFRQIGDGVATLQQRLPHFVGGVHVAREPGGQTDDRDVGHIAGSRPVLIGVYRLEFGLTVDDHRRQRLDRGVPEGHRSGQGDAGEVLDVAGHRHRIPRGEAEFHHGSGLVDCGGRLPGGVGHPVPQPPAHLGHGHLGANGSQFGSGRGSDRLSRLGCTCGGGVRHGTFGHSASSGKALATFPLRRVPSRYADRQARRPIFPLDVRGMAPAGVSRTSRTVTP